MARAKRTQVTTTTELPAKTATITAAEKKNGHNANVHPAFDLESAIRSRAYELYEQRGRQDGYAQDDWFQAEAEMRTQYSRTA